MFRNVVAPSIFAVLVLAASVHAEQVDTYRVGSRDVLEVAVWSHAELSGKFTVAPDGTIEFPLLGPIKVAERTAEEIESDIRTQLADGFLRKPQVSVQVAQFLSQRLYVMGEVRTPGPIPLKGSVTLLEALSNAGSLTEQAGGEVILLRRKDPQTVTGPLAPGEEIANELGRVSVQQLRSGAVNLNVALQDGDTIFVPRAEFIYVLGMVNSPGPYLLQPGMTTVLSAIARAGGVNQLGSTGSVRVTRIVDGKKVELKVNVNDELKPGDTVTVGTRLF